MVGLLYIVFILGLQAILLSLVGFGGELSLSKNKNNKNNKNNIKNNTKNTKSNTNKISSFLKKYTLSSMNNMKK